MLVEDSLLDFDTLLRIVLLGQPTAWSEERIYKVGILVTTSAASPPPLYRQFTDALRALGYIPDRNVTFEYARRARMTASRCS